MSNPTSPGQVPKAILYTWPTSVWSTVPRLCLIEKGYSDEEYAIKNVDITKGENFAPSYLKINMNGTVPTLVVPTLETTGSEVDTRFRSLRDTVTICDFLDQARSASSSRTVSDKPAPALAPATIEGKATSDSLITLVHQPTVDPNFLHLACSSRDELSAKSAGQEGKLLNDRKAGLARYVSEAEQLAEKAGAGKEGRVTYEQKMLAFLHEKQAANELLWQLYNNQAGKDREEAFFTASDKSWTEALPQVLAQLDEGFKGPYSLGDQISLADLHIVAWLARVVLLAGGKSDASGIEALEKRLGGKAIGTKVKAFWTAWLERDSFKRVYADSLH